MSNEDQDENNRLPTDWVSERLSGIICSDMQADDQDLLRVELTPVDDARFYGIRPASELSVAPGDTACLRLVLAADEHAKVARPILVLREFDHQGTFLFQVQKPVWLPRQPTTFAVHLTVRESERIVQPAVLFEREKGQTAGATLLMGTITLSVL